jgi:hypothetical protein
MKHEEPKKSERLTVVDVFAIDTIYLRLVAYNWKHIRSKDLNALEKIIVDQRRLFNEISVAWNALHANPKQSDMAKYLLNMLEAICEAKKRFDEYWDANVNITVDKIKLVKHGKQKQS